MRIPKHYLPQVVRILLNQYIPFDDPSHMPFSVPPGSVNSPGLQAVFWGRRTLIGAQKLSAHSTILRTTAETTLKQQFSNTSQAIKECIYMNMFPLLDGVRVFSLTCQVGDRTIHGVVKEKRMAKANYEAAKVRPDFFEIGLVS